MRVHINIKIRLLLLALIAASAPLAAEANPNEAAEFFKRFVASPPVIENVIFKIKLPTRLTNSAPEDISVQNSTNYQYYEARWQPDATWIRVLGYPEETTNLFLQGTVVSRFAQDYWLLDHRGAAILWHDDGKAPQPTNSLVKVERNEPLIMATHLERRLAEALNMGVFLVGIGSLQWNGNNLSGFYPKEQVTVNGELTLGSDGRASEIHLHFRGPDSEARYLIRYGYGHDVGLSYLPSLIRTYQMVDGNEVQRAEIGLVSLRIGVQPQSRTAFSPEKLIAANLLEKRYYTNGQIFLRTKRGKLELPPEGPVLSYKGETVKGFYFAVAAMMAVSLFVLLGRIKSRNETLNQSGNIC